LQDFVLTKIVPIREKGVLAPIIVTPRDGKYLLISGERRLRACRLLGLATVPARVIDAVTAKDEILALQRRKTSSARTSIRSIRPRRWPDIFRPGMERKGSIWTESSIR
jgi:ParB/RepB/Spo0J family partition protein